MLNAKSYICMLALFDISDPECTLSINLPLRIILTMSSFYGSVTLLEVFFFAKNSAWSTNITMYKPLVPNAAYGQIQTLVAMSKSVIYFSNQIIWTDANSCCQLICLIKVLPTREQSVSRTRKAGTVSCLHIKREPMILLYHYLD